MPKFVALLRGINVGKAKRIPMAELRALLSALGYTGVATLLNSGNAVFQSQSGTPSQLATDIAAGIFARLHIQVPVVVVSASELETIVSENPIRVPDDEHPQVLVAFVQDSKTLSRLVSIASLVAPPEQFSVGRNAAYLLCAAGILESKAGKALLGLSGAVTTRNWATVLKLQALVKA